MAKCKICKKKILYNKYKIIEGEVYCPKCNPSTEKKEKEFCADVKSTVKLTFVADALQKTIDDAKNLDFSKMLEAPKKRRKSKKE